MSQKVLYLESSFVAGIKINVQEICPEECNAILEVDMVKRCVLL